MKEEEGFDALFQTLHTIFFYVMDGETYLGQELSLIFKSVLNSYGRDQKEGGKKTLNNVCFCKH